MKRILKDLIESFVIAFIILFTGLIIGFFFYVSLFDHTFLNNLQVYLDPLTYNQVLTQSGYYNPLFLRFMQYITNFFTGNWGIAHLIGPLEVTELMQDITPITIEVLILPILLGLGIGIILRRHMKKNRKKGLERLIQIFIAISISIPLFAIISTFQREFGRYLEVLYWKSPITPNPPEITGFPLFDSLLSGNWEIGLDIFMHYLLPGFSLMLVIIPLFALQARSPIKNNSIFSNSQIIGRNLLYIFIYLLVMEISFSFTGFGYVFYLSLMLGDPFALNGFIYQSLLLIFFVVLISNLFFLIYNGYKRKELNKPAFIVRILGKSVINHEEIPVKKERLMNENNNKDDNDLNINRSLKKILLKRLKSPSLIVGLVIICFAIFISLFPFLITQYDISEVTPPYPSPDPAYSPPTILHLLGTTRFGYDLGALLVWGTRDSIIFGSSVVGIGLAGGLLFGFLTTLNNWFKKVIMGLMTIVNILPAVFLLFIPFFISMKYFQIPLFGILLIPSFTRVITQTKFKKENIQTLVSYIPREFLLTLILYYAVTYLGIGYGPTSLGRIYNYGLNAFGALWFTLWPGITIFTLSIGFYLLYNGLKPNLLKISKKD